MSLHQLTILAILAGELKFWEQLVLVELVYGGLEVVVHELFKLLLLIPANRFNIDVTFIFPAVCLFSLRVHRHSQDVVGFSRRVMLVLNCTVTRLLF